MQDVHLGVAVVTAVLQCSVPDALPASTSCCGARYKPCVTYPTVYPLWVLTSAVRCGWQSNAVNNINVKIKGGCQFAS